MISVKKSPNLGEQNAIKKPSKFPNFIPSIPHTTPLTAMHENSRNSLTLDSSDFQTNYGDYSDYSGEENIDNKELFPEYYFPGNEDTRESNPDFHHFSEKIGIFDSESSSPIIVGERRKGGKVRKVKGRKKPGNSRKTGSFAQLVTFKPSSKLGLQNHKRDEVKKRSDFGFSDFINYDHSSSLDHRSGYGAPHNGFDHSFAASSGYGDDGHDDHKPASKGGYTPERKPGPYGYPSPNFKCEYAKETLYVTKTDWTFDKKCFTVYR